MRLLYPEDVPESLYTDDSLPAAGVVSNLMIIGWYKRFRSPPGYSPKRQRILMDFWVWGKGGMTLRMECDRNEA